MLLQLNSMEGLLKTLVAGQSKQTEAFKHQEDVSVYIKHLQEYLAEDRTQRKEEFATSGLQFPAVLEVRTDRFFNPISFQSKNP